MVTEEMQARFRDLLEKIDEQCLKYEEEHGDAGGGYAHLVKEDKSVSLTRVREYLVEQFPETTTEERAAIVKLFDEWCFDMEPGNRFTTINPEKGCCVGSWALEEVENQVEVSYLAETLECSKEDIREMVRAEKDRKDFCIGTLYRDDFSAFETYQVTDGCWFAVVPREWFVDMLEEIRDNSYEE
jgi:hypothetical protein